MSISSSHEDAPAIWRAGVAAVRPERCLPAALESLPPGFPALSSFERVLVVGAGKAGAAMSRALETALEQQGVDLQRVQGVVNVPNETVTPLERIRLHPARPAGINQPTESGIEGAKTILALAEGAGPNDLLLCLISGGGSALLPLPAPGLTLADKQQVTALLHGCGATIQEMNTVRKHLSRIKGGGLVRGFGGKRALSLIVSDVIGDPLDVIASGPTCPDPTTFADALAVLARHNLVDRVPRSVLAYLREGAEGKQPETVKQLPLGEDGRPLVENVILASNRQALTAAAAKAKELGYAVWNFGSYLDGDTARLAEMLARIAQGVAAERKNSAERGPSGPRARPLAILSGGETTVVLPEGHGLGGRNQQFVLAFLNQMSGEALGGVTVLSGGTDGEDGPTDAAGAIGDAEVLDRAAQAGLNPADYLARHDAYHFFQPLDALLKTGLTQTNVMDLRVILVDW